MAVPDLLAEHPGTFPFRIGFDRRCEGIKQTKMPGGFRPTSIL
jgi:hypothetical protein